jgi:UDP-glucose 4-epimerase
MGESQPTLITGGAGYIGSHAVMAFRDAGLPVVVLDNLTTGRRYRLPADIPFVEGDAGDAELAGDIIRSHRIATVVHFAGSIVVPESVTDPLKYYRNNTCTSRNLIEASVAGGVRRFVFSSTAAVYGMPEQVPISEDAPTVPINPYGASKLMTEWMLRDTAAAADFNFVALRYFNVAGADPQGRSGQATKNATHVIEVAGQAALGLRDGFEIFGDDYDTPDGTCVRDYIHVSDLAEAHLLAVRYLEGGGRSATLNLGNERGFSVREVAEAMRKVSGRDFPVRIGPRRPGDPACLVSSAARARDLLGWRPSRTELETQIADAWNWHQKERKGGSRGSAP